MLADSLSNITIHDKSFFINFPHQHDFNSNEIMTNGILGINNYTIIVNEINNPYTVTGIVLIILMLLVSAFWYFTPTIIKTNFTSLFQNPLKRNWELNSNSAGLFINLILYLNFLLVLPLVLVKTSPIYSIDSLVNLQYNKTISYLNILLLTFVIFRIFFVWITSWIFDTKFMGKAHNKMFNNLEKAIGVIFLPLLFTSMYISAQWLIWLNAFILGVFILSRWIFTVIIGIRITKFSWFHIILYLCTLEIVPILLAIKLVRNGFF